MDDTQAQKLLETSKELLAAIDKRWEMEPEKKRERSISPRQEDAMEELRTLIATIESN